MTLYEDNEEPNTEDTVAFEELYNDVVVNGDLPTGDSVDYSEVKDPEMNPKAAYDTGYLSGKGGSNSLTEAKMTNPERIKAYLAEDPEPSYEGFMKSSYRPDGEYGLNKFKAACKALETEGNEQASALLAKYGRNAAKAYGPGTSVESHDSGPYERISTGVEDDTFKKLQAFSQRTASATVSMDADDMYYEMENMVRELLLNEADKRHLVIAGDPGIGKTFTVMEAIKQYCTNGRTPSGQEVFYMSGDLGSSLTAIVPFFYFHSQNEIIVMDDNDTMIMDTCTQAVQNTMKAIMDPKAIDEKPIGVRSNMRDAFANSLANYESEVGVEAARYVKKGKEENKVEESCGKLIEVDLDNLNEGVLTLRVDGVEVINECLLPSERAWMLNHCRPLTEKEERKIEHRLNEAIGDDDDDNDLNDDFVDEEDDGMLDTSEDADVSGEGSSFPSAFFFDSSICFISNLSKERISSAVADRAEMIEIKLTIDQYLDRLGKIYKGLGKPRAGAVEMPKATRDWCKEVTYASMCLAAKAYNESVPLFDKIVDINQKLTFRMFDETVTALGRYLRAASRGTTRCILTEGENIPAGDISSKAWLNANKDEFVARLVRDKIIPTWRQKGKF